MALKSTIFKALLHVSDIDRHVYQDFPLTLARHPSETDERMVMRLAAFAWHADERLQFGKGLSTDDEPALWLKNLDDSIELWLDVGLPDEDRIRKASHRARQVVVYTYGSERNVDVWWRKLEDKLQRFDNVSICQIPSAASQALAGMAGPGMDWQCTVQEGELAISDNRQHVPITLHWLKKAASP